MRSIGESCVVSGGRNTGAVHDVARCALQPQPENIWAQGNANRLCKDVHEMGWRQVRYACQRPQRKIISNTESIPEVLEYAIHSGMNPDRAAPMKQLCFN